MASGSLRRAGGRSEGEAAEAGRGERAAEGHCARLRDERDTLWKKVVLRQRYFYVYFSDDNFFDICIQMLRIN